MPIYEYVCQSCGRPFEQLLRSMQGDAGMVCPHCQSRSVERQLSVFAARGSETASCGVMPDLPKCPGCPGGNGGGMCGM